jgi:gliding motility-associated-like protein
MSNKDLVKVLLAFFWLIIFYGFNGVLAQAPGIVYPTRPATPAVVIISVVGTTPPSVAPPHITYNTPDVYPINTPIAPLTPANTGGAVPATLFGRVTTFAGVNNSPGYLDATGTNAKFSKLWGIDIDAAGNLYVSDNTRIRKVTPAAVVSTLAGGFRDNQSDGTGAAAGFNTVAGLSVSPSGNIFVGDINNHSIREVTPAGVVTTFIGASTINGLIPAGVATDRSGNVYVADQASNLIRRITPAGVASIYAGNTGPTFNDPSDLDFDISGNLYVADTKDNMIREISTTGAVTTLAGSLAPGLVNAIGAAARFDQPSALAVDPAKNIYVADAFGLVIRLIDPSGKVISVAGNDAIRGSADGIQSEATFNNLAGLVYSNGELFATDLTSIREIVVTGYTIDIPLPPGLIFDSATGIISGTPVAASPPTVYTITAYNTGGSSSFQVTISVIGTQSVVFNPIAPKTICDADFDPGATGTGTITYTSDNAAVATIVNGKIHITGVGTANITASNGIATLTQTLTVAAADVPSVSIVSTQTGAVCSGTPITFTAVPVNGGVNPGYQWQVNGVNAGPNNATFTSATLASGDIVNCMMTNNDATACLTTRNAASNTLTANIRTSINATVSISPSTTVPVCAASPLTFTATTNGGSNIHFQWSVNGQNAGTDNSTFSSSVFIDGDVVTCTISSDVDCLAPVTSLPYTVMVSPLPTITFNGNAVINLGNTIQLNPQITGNIASYAWTPVTGLSDPTIASPVASPKVTTKYQLMVTTTAGCPASGTITVTVLTAITVPNAFTPNGDGFNDIWNIKDLIYYPNCMVSVYDRYGGLVYQSKGYSQPWDGTRNGSQVPVGTYYYIIDLRNSTPKLTGYVAVIR